MGVKPLARQPMLAFLRALTFAGMATPLAAYAVGRSSGSVAPTRRAAAPRAMAVEAPFEAQLKHFAPAAELPRIRSQVAQLEMDLHIALDEQNFVHAAMMRDDLAELRAKDPALLAASLRERMERLVRRESYSEAAATRDQLIVLRRFQPQYQLAGLWKGAPGPPPWPTALGTARGLDGGLRIGHRRSVGPTRSAAA